MVIEQRKFSCGPGDPGPRLSLPQEPTCVTDLQAIPSSFCNKLLQAVMLIGTAHRVRQRI